MRQRGFNLRKWPGGFHGRVLYIVTRRVAHESSSFKSNFAGSWLISCTNYSLHVKFDLLSSKMCSHWLRSISDCSAAKLQKLSLRLCRVSGTGVSLFLMRSWNGHRDWEQNLRQFEEWRSESVWTSRNETTASCKSTSLAPAPFDTWTRLRRTGLESASSHRYYLSTDSWVIEIIP